MDIGRAIINWYNENKRDLPWRNTSDPYSIWVSEIIMQQTRINQGLSYYLNFLHTFPSVHHLAQANEDQVLMVWQGLGYYSRARNMHFTAKQIVADYNGLFPNTSQELKKLKGIGAYTSAAIASICFNENLAAIDGNVIRVISRLFNITDDVRKNSILKEIDDLSQKIVKNVNASIYNQAMMDLGASICSPKNPSCEKCPLNNVCKASQYKTQNIVPFKSKNNAVKMRHFAYFVIKTKTQTLIRKRFENDIWKGLFEFPLIEFTKVTSINNILELGYTKKYLESKKANLVQIIEAPPHKLSHQTLHAYIIVNTQSSLPNIDGYQTIEIGNINSYAFPRLIEKQLENIFI